MRQLKALLKRILLRTTGLSVFHITLLKSMNHIKWYFLKLLEPGEKHYPWPKLDFSFREQRPDPADEAIAAYILEEYKSKFSMDPKNASSIWSYNLNLHFKPLYEAMDSKNPEALASVLSRMFSSSVLYGISSAHLFARENNFKLGRKVVSVKILDDLVVLGEYLGVIPAECAEQGLAFIGVKDGAEALVRKIEERLGIELNFPEVGSAYGLQIGHRLITPEMPEHIFVAFRITELLKRYDPEFSSPQKRLRIVEIGAGFGGTGYWLNKLMGAQIASYTIVDMPIVNVMQSYFFGKSFSAGDVRIWKPGDQLDKRFNFVSCDLISKLEGPFDLLINENSMPEIPLDSVQNYLQWASRHVQGHFYSYNQEAFTPRDPQVYVPGETRKIPSYRLLQRGLSPIRRGYAEEIYSLR